MARNKIIDTASSDVIDERDLYETPIPMSKKTQYYTKFANRSKPRNDFGDSDNDKLPDNVAHILQYATKFDLLEHKNHAYGQLLSAYNVLKEQQNFILKKLPDTLQISDILQRLDNLTSMVSSLSAGSNDLALPISSDLSENKPCKEDYPNVRFWYRHEWDVHVVESKLNQTWRQDNTKDATCDTLGFITNINGISINGYQASVIRQLSRQLWHSLAKTDSDPPNWGSADASVVKFFRSNMYAEYPDLRLCENDWKVDMIAQKDYPNWRKVYRSEKSRNSSIRVKRPQSNSPELIDAVTVPATKPNGLIKKAKIHANSKPNSNFKVTGAASSSNASNRRLPPQPPPTHVPASTFSSKTTMSSFASMKNKLAPTTHRPSTPFDASHEQREISSSPTTFDSLDYNTHQHKIPTAVNTLALEPRSNRQMATNINVAASIPNPSLPRLHLKPPQTHIASSSTCKTTPSSTTLINKPTMLTSFSAISHPPILPVTNTEQSFRTPFGSPSPDAHCQGFPIMNPFSKKTTVTSSASQMNSYHASEQPAPLEEEWEETPTCQEPIVVAAPESAMEREEEESRGEEINQAEQPEQPEQSQHPALTNVSVPALDLPQHQHSRSATTYVPATIETRKSKNRRNDDALFKYNKQSNSTINLFGFDYLKEHLGAKPTNAQLLAAYEALPSEKRQEYEAQRLGNLRRKHA